MPRQIDSKNRATKIGEQKSNHTGLQKREQTIDSTIQQMQKKKHEDQQD